MTGIALVTAAGRGLGRNTALSIPRRGGDVVLNCQSRAEDAPAAVAKIQAMGREAMAFQLDAGDSRLRAVRRPAADGAFATPGRARRSITS
jgi:NAD(P)-dependent dehydrogenase (short-subunit alcohol dehydrogenase family)